MTPLPTMVLWEQLNSDSAVVLVMFWGPTPPQGRTKHNHIFLETLASLSIKWMVVKKSPILTCILHGYLKDPEVKQMRH